MVSCKHCSLDGTRGGVVAISVFAFFLWATSGGSVDECLRRGGPVRHHSCVVLLDGVRCVSRLNPSCDGDLSDGSARTKYGLGDSGACSFQRVPYHPVMHRVNARCVTG